MTDYNELIYVDDLESYYVEDAVREVYDSYVNDMKEEVENELIEEGYEYEKADETYKLNNKYQNGSMEKYIQKEKQ